MTSASNVGWLPFSGSRKSALWPRIASAMSTCVPMPNFDDADEGAGELAGFGEMIEQVGNGGDLVGFFRHAELRQGQPGVGRIGGERVQGLQSLAAIMRSSGGLAVDGDEIVPARPERGDPILETPAEQMRVHAVDEGAQPSGAGDAVMELGKAPQSVDMMFAPVDDIVEIVARA